MYTPRDKLPGRVLSAFLAASLLAAAAVGARAADSVVPVIAPVAPVAPVVPGSRPVELTGEGARALLGELSGKLGSVLPASRKLMLGTRDPAGPSCVRLHKLAELRARKLMVRVSNAGGVGTRFLAFYRAGQRASGKQDFLWQQVRLRSYLNDGLGRSRATSAGASAMAKLAGELAGGMARWKAFPKGLAPAAAAGGNSWAAWCLNSLNEAISARDLPRARRWSAELAAACFTLADLHRWFEFLVDNHLAALDFQARCESVYQWIDEVNGARGIKYDSLRIEDRAPASSLVLPLTANFLEIERQAEWLFRVPKSYLSAGDKEIASVPAAVWMPPDLRADFVFLRSCLSQANRAAWDLAAAAPYDRSYLANILFRLSTAKAIEELAVVLKRFDAAHPSAMPAELMDVMFYRGEVCGGLVWDDRFDSRLIQAGRELVGSPGQALRAAHDLAHDTMGSWANYRGEVYTLGEALDTRKLDCVRGTDMIAGLYRNSGRGGVYNVHLSCAVASHSVAGVGMVLGGKRVVALSDSLVAQDAGDLWPQAYFRGFAWPEGYPGSRGPVFSAEMCVRGLDNYVFAEGYVVRGPHAGLLARAAVPYLPERSKTVITRAYEGPYPPIPSSGLPPSTAPRKVSLH